jgi:hypothetical protein
MITPSMFPSSITFVTGRRRQSIHAMTVCAHQINSSVKNHRISGPAISRSPSICELWVQITLSFWIRLTDGWLRFPPFQFKQMNPLCRF